MTDRYADLYATPHDAVSFGRTPGYEPRCMIEGARCQGRAVAICWECVLLTCVSCAQDHSRTGGNDGK